MDESDGEGDTRTTAPTRSVRPALRAVVGGGALVIQFAVATYVLTLRPEAVSRAIGPGILGLSFLVVAAVGYDAWRVGSGPDSEWSPNPFLWALPMILPAINLGVGVAYAGRRVQFRSDGLDHLWGWSAVIAGVLSGVSFAVLTAIGVESQPLSPGVAVLQTASLALFSLTTLATYYDTRYIRARLEEDGQQWLFHGYHWVLAMSVPLPLRMVIALVYALRRWMLLGSVPPVNPDWDMSGDTDSEEND